MDDATITRDFFSNHRIITRSSLKHHTKVKTYIRSKMLNAVVLTTNEYDWYGNTSLHVAVRDAKCTPEAVFELLEGGEDVNAKNHVGDTPLSFAVYYNCRVDVIRLLLVWGADIHASNHFLDTALHRALDRSVVNIEIVKILLEYGAKVNQCNKRGEAALHYCLHLADVELVRLLLDHGADYRATNNYGNTILHLALDTKYNLELIHLLIDTGIPIDSQNMDRDTPLQMSLRNRVCRPDVIKLLLDKGANCNLQNKYNEYPLHIALKNVACSTRGVIQMLLYYGASVNASDLRGNSVLHTACISFHCNVEIIRLLLNNGANVNALNKFEDTPLHVALMTPLSTCLNCRFEVIKLLVAHGASLDAVSLENGTPLHVAVSRTNCDIDIVKLMLDRGADVNAKSIFGRSALFAALRNPKVDIAVVKLLLSKHVLVDTVDDHSNTPLHYALENPKCPLEVIKLLLENNGKLHKKNWDEDTPVHCALRWGNLKVIRFLLANRGRINVLDGDCKFPLESAIEKYNQERDNNSKELVKLLIKYSYLEKRNFEIRDLICTCWDYPAMVKFSIYCVEETQRMDSEYVTEGLPLSGLISGRSRQLAAKWKNMKWDIKYLLDILAQNKYPVYNEVIATTIKRKVMFNKLKDNLVYTVSKFTDVKSVLSYYSACYVTNYLPNGDLLNVLLAFHKSCPPPIGQRLKCKPKKSSNKKRKQHSFDHKRKIFKISTEMWKFLKGDESDDTSNSYELPEPFDGCG